MFTSVCVLVLVKLAHLPLQLLHQTCTMVCDHHRVLRSYVHQYKLQTQLEITMHMWPLRQHCLANSAARCWLQSRDIRATQEEDKMRCLLVVAASIDLVPAGGPCRLLLASCCLAPGQKIPSLQLMCSASRQVGFIKCISHFVISNMTYFNAPVLCCVWSMIGKS